jgi:chitinase
MGYYSVIGSPALPVASIQWSGLTHVAQVAAMVNGDGTLNLSSYQVSSTAAALVSAAHANNVKALIDIYQNGSTYLQQAVNCCLSTLVTNIMTVVNTYGYDGVDIDWEPFDGSTNGSAMTALAQALRLALGSRLLTVNMEDSTWWAANQSNYSYFDRLSAMTYSMSGAWPHNGPLWYAAALHCTGLDSVYLCVDTLKTIWLNAGVPANKLNLGLPFYGDKWSGGVLASDPAQGISGPRQTWQTGHGPTWTESIDYNAIVPMITQQNYTWDSSAVVPYINYIGTTPSAYWYLTYENPQSIQAKVQYIIAQNLGGWIIYHLGMDWISGASHPHPLLDAVQAGSAPAVLSASALSSGTVGRSYGASLGATGAAPLHWALSSGSLPSGLSLSSAGVISGTPMTAGTFTFIVTVGNFAGSAAQSFTITIASSLAAISTSDHKQHRQRQVGTEVYHLVVDAQTADAQHDWKRQRAIRT